MRKKTKKPVIFRPVKGMEQKQDDDINLLLELLVSSSSEKLQRQAFEKLFLFYWKPLKSYAERRIDKDEIDDLLQDMFSFLWLNRKSLLAEKIKNKKSLEKWLMDFVRSKSANIRKQKARQVRIDDENIREEIDNKTVLPAEQLSAVALKEYEEAIQVVVEKLPSDLRLVWSLKRNHDYSTESIAKYMQLTESQVKDKFRKAKIIVQEKMLQIYQLDDLLSGFN